MHRLEAVIWSILNQLNRYDDPRPFHLRTVWLKQMELLSYEKGIHLKTMGLRVTYANAIQASRVALNLNRSRPLVGHKSNR